MPRFKFKESRSTFYFVNYKQDKVLPKIEMEIKNLLLKNLDN